MIIIHTSSSGSVARTCVRRLPWHFLYEAGGGDGEIGYSSHYILHTLHVL